MGLYVPVTAAVRLINFARVIVLTWFMTTQQFGLLNVLLLVINVLTPVASVGLNEAVTRYAPQYESRGSLNEFLRKTFVLVVLVTAMSALLLLAVAPFVGMRVFGTLVYDELIRSEFATQVPELTRLCALMIVLLTLYFFLLAVFKGLRMIRALAAIEMLHSLAFIALVVAIAVLGRGSAKTVTACYGLSLLFAIVVMGVGLYRRLGHWSAQAHPCDDSSLHKRMLAFSYWAMISGVTWQLLQYYPAWYLNREMGNDAVAVFSAVRQIGQFVLLAAITLVTVVMTAVTKTWETRGVEAADRQLSLAFRGAGTLMLLGCVVLALSRELIIRMFRPVYAPGADVLPLQLLFFVVGGNFAFIALHFNLIEKPRLHFLPYAVGVAANVVLAFWFVGPRLQALRATTLWQSFAPLANAVFSTGMSDALGLGGASWAGVLAILAALGMCLMLLRAEGRRVDRGSYIVLLASLLLATRNEILVVGTLLFVWIALGTTLVFTADERRALLTYARGALRSAFRFSHAPSHSHVRDSAD